MLICISKMHMLVEVTMVSGWHGLTMFSVKYIDDVSFTDENWQAYYSLMELLHDKYQGRFARSHWQDFKRVHLEFIKSEECFHRFTVFDNDKITGWASLRILNKGTPQQVAYFMCDAAYNVIPKGVARVVADELVRLMPQYDCKSAAFMALAERIARVGDIWGVEKLGQINRFRLYRDKANDGVIEQWLNEIPAANPDLRIEFYEAVPEEYVDEYAETFTLFLNEMPAERHRSEPYHLSPDMVRRQTEFRKTVNEFQCTYLLLDRDNRIVGHSNVAISGRDSTDAYQAMTGVVSQYRGRGLSKWLKAAIYKKIGERFPDNKMMTSDMRAVNKPIQAVNARMGFVLKSRGGEYEISPEQLRRFLDEK
jgi:hypothetical protein